MFTKGMLRAVIHLFMGPFTNLFPARHLPQSMSGFFKDVADGKETILPPVPVPDGFKGKLGYDKEKCIGCRMCIRVCPANAISLIAEEKKVFIHMDRCTFCSQCNDACPVHCLYMTDEFLLSTYDRKQSKILDSGPKIKPDASAS